MRAVVLALLLPLAAVSADSGPTWQRSFFFDEAKSDFSVSDFACPSATFCIAVGAIEQNTGAPYPHAVITRDGGAHWSASKPAEFPVSLFFLNDTTGWMVTEHGIWSTVDAAATWKKVQSGKAYFRVFFTDAQHGWLVGDKRQFEQTADGGAHWSALPDVANAVAASPAPIAFEYVHFSDPRHGVAIAEAGGRPDRGLPVWMDPDSAQYRRAPEGGVCACQSSDGGHSWTCGSVGLYRKLITAAFPAANRGWLVFEPESPSKLFSEVIERNWSAWQSTTVWHLDGASILDLSAGADGLLAIAAVQIQGKLIDSPLPGKVRIFSGGDFASLREEPVDYRAVARRIMLANAGSEWFAATDTGMILHRLKP